jgi:hypothetical protein
MMFILTQVENWIDFDTNPLYAIMHEAIYCQGAASKWAAHRVRQELGDQFDAVKSVSNGRRVLFTGEVTCIDFQYYLCDVVPGVF